MQKRIAFIGFGGTIAMVRNDRGFLAPARTANELVAQVPLLRGLDAKLDIIQLQNKDSTNLNPADWQLLINKIAELYPNYDGFIITHGTDTMSHTATAVAFAFGQQLSKPIMFTGAQSPMTDLGGDARVNLERTMKVALQAIDDCINEVMIVFSNRVLRAVRTIKKSEFGFDAFDSPAFPNLGVITSAGITFSPFVRKLPNKQHIYTIPKPQNTFSSNIMTIDTKPGLNPQMIRELANSSHCAGIILRSFGAGIVPSEGKHSLIPVIQEAVTAGKPVIITSRFAGGKTVQTVYETGQAPIYAGASLAGDMTDVATEVKLAWIMGQGLHNVEKIKTEMLKNYIGEVS